MSLSRNTSSNSLQISSPPAPKKPERSFIEAGGKAANIYKFDCQLERNPIKHSSGSLDKVVANQTSVTNISDQTPEKKKKKTKKEKKQKKDKKEKKKEKEKEEKSVGIDDVAKTLKTLAEIEKRENLRLEMERDDIWSVELPSDIEKETNLVQNMKVRSNTKNKYKIQIVSSGGKVGLWLSDRYAIEVKK